MLSLPPLANLPSLFLRKWSGNKPLQPWGQRPRWRSQENKAFFEACISFLCLSIVQKKWSLVRVEVLGKNQQSHTWGQNHRSHSKNCSLDWFHWFVNQSSHCWLWENFEVTLVFLSCHHHQQHNKFWTTRIDWHMLPAESYFACFIMQEIITKSSTLSITFFCLRKSIGDLNSCSPNFCQYSGMSIGL